MMNLSFNIKEIDLRKGIVIAIVVVVGMMTPIAVLCWYALGGGSERVNRQALAQLRGREPVRDALEAVHEGKFALIAYGPFTDPTVPGVGRPEDTYRRLYGYRYLQPIRCSAWPDGPRPSLSREDQALQADAIRYAAIYNSTVWRSVAERYRHEKEQIEHPPRQSR